MRELLKSHFEDMTKQGSDPNDVAALVQIAKLKKAWNFKPKEPYGVSNNPKIESLRLPKWSEAGFQVPMNGVDITLDLVDP